MTTEFDAVADALPAYEVGGEIGRGASGVVLAGRHRRLDSDVAIKLLFRNLLADAAVRERFLAEARLLATLDHPHIVRLLDFVEVGDLCLLVMERLTGGTVRDRMRAGRPSVQSACAVALAAAGGLQYAHGRGVLHRDIKPENLMFSAEGVLKVTDFGIAKVLGDTVTHGIAPGYVLGTPDYVAPEQIQGKALSPATDVYALGTLLYELVSGNVPFPRGSDPMLTLYQHAHEEPRRLLDVAPDTPPELARVVDRALARDPARRFPTADQFGRAVVKACSATWGRDWRRGTGVVIRRVPEHDLEPSPEPRTEHGAQTLDAAVFAADTVIPSPSWRPPSHTNRPPVRREVPLWRNPITALVTVMAVIVLGVAVVGAVMHRAGNAASTTSGENQFGTLASCEAAHGTGQCAAKDGVFVAVGGDERVSQGETTSTYAAPAAAGPQGVAARDFQFDPATKNVNIGDNIKFTNASTTTTHNVSFETPVPSNFGNMAPGGTVSSAVFTQAGTFTYFCNIHPNQMRGTVVAVSSGAASTGAAVTSPTSPPQTVPSRTPQTLPSSPPTTRCPTGHVTGSAQLTFNHPDSNNPDFFEITGTGQATNGTNGTIRFEKIEVQIIDQATGQQITLTYVTPTGSNTMVPGQTITLSDSDSGQAKSPAAGRQTLNWYYIGEGVYDCPNT